MNVATPLPQSAGAGAIGPAGAPPRRGAAYLRQYRAQPRRGVRSRVLVLLLLGLALLFLRVWERTEANALAMERDRLSREVRALENRIQLSTELADQAALREGLSMSLLRSHGFQSPDPTHIIEIAPALIAVSAAPAPGGLRAGLARALRRVLPEKTVGSGTEMPATIHAGVGQ